MRSNTELDIRSRCLQAALDEFYDVSFEEATMRNIARRAHLSVATLYKYYESKTNLTVILNTQIMKNFDDGLELHLRGIVGTADKIRKMIWYYLHFFEAHEKEAWLLFVSSAHSVYYLALQPIHGIARSEADRFEQLLKMGQETGEVRENLDVRMARAIFFGSLHEIITRWLNRRKMGRKNSLVEYFDSFADITITAFQTRQTSLSPGELKTSKIARS